MITNEEAINVLRIMASGIELKGYTELWISSFKEAYEMAIKALVERPKGEWIIVKDERYGDNVKCPFCGKELAGTDLNFCCKCGAKLLGSEKMNGGANGETT